MAGFLKCNRYFSYHTHTHTCWCYKTQKEVQEQCQRPCCCGFARLVLLRQHAGGSKLFRSSSLTERTRLPLTTWSAVTRDSLMMPASFPSIPPSIHHLALHPSVGSPIPQMHVLGLWEEAASTSTEIAGRRCKPHGKVPLAPGRFRFVQLFTPWMCRVHLFFFWLCVCVPGTAPSI